VAGEAGHLDYLREMLRPGLSWTVGSTRAAREDEYPHSGLSGAATGKYCLNVCDATALEATIRTLGQEEANAKPVHSDGLAPEEAIEFLRELPGARLVVMVGARGVEATLSN
jgi:hypothetical protein